MTPHPVPASLLALACCTACTGEPAPKHATERCDEACAAGAIVRVGAECTGVVVQSEPSRVTVLTAAHCVAANERPLLHFASGDTLRATVSWRDLAFDPSTGAAAHDLARLTADDPPSRVRAVPISSVTPTPREVRVLTAGGGRLGPPGTVQRASGLTLSFATSGRVRPGDSGAPVLSEAEEGGLVVVGVVSRGPASGEGSVIAARAWPAAASLASTESGRRRTCGECIDELGEARDTCTTSLHRCRAQPSCGRWVACLEDAVDEASARACTLAETNDDRPHALMRCAVANGCRSVCGRAGAVPDIQNE